MLTHSPEKREDDDDEDSSWRKRVDKQLEEVMVDGQEENKKVNGEADDEAVDDELADRKGGEVGEKKWWWAELPKCCKEEGKCCEKLKVKHGEAREESRMLLEKYNRLKEENETLKGENVKGGGTKNGEGSNVKAEQEGSSQGQELSISGDIVEIERSCTASDDEMQVDEGKPISIGSDDEVKAVEEPTGGGDVEKDSWDGPVGTARATSESKEIDERTSGEDSKEGKGAEKDLEKDNRSKRSKKSKKSRMQKRREDSETERSEKKGKKKGGRRRSGDSSKRRERRKHKKMSRSSSGTDRSRSNKTSKKKEKKEKKESRRGRRGSERRREKSEGSRRRRRSTPRSRDHRERKDKDRNGNRSRSGLNYRRDTRQRSSIANASRAVVRSASMGAGGRVTGPRSSGQQCEQGEPIIVRAPPIYLVGEKGGKLQSKGAKSGGKQEIKGKAKGKGKGAKREWNEEGKGQSWNNGEWTTKKWSEEGDESQPSKKGVMFQKRSKGEKE